MARRRFTAEEDAVLKAGRQATPPVRFIDLARQLGRNEQAVRSRVSYLGGVHNLPLAPVNPQKPGASHRSGRRNDPRLAPPAFPARRCLQCRIEFNPPSRFIFRCETHRHDG